eukprot:TRINITY_DN2335_c0_g1_i2.p1 TRINITY_DN2335_c0_g1~~TRINITY_DN2335_c0_g1_i2.p1  ORF type:complete len:315 (+),score=57.26 TRINITY_DN2335_c0_g1_i2:337-1281(+)
MKCFVIKENTFASGAQLFYDDSYEPYIYKVPRYLVRFEKLMTVAGMRMKLKPSHLLNILSQIHEEYPSSVPTEIQEIVIAILARLTSFSKGSLQKALQQNILYIPDANFVLSPSSDMIFMDSFIEGIDLEPLLPNITHHSITRQQAQDLHISFLSHIVTEKIISEESILCEPSSNTKTYTDTIRSHEFQLGFLRILNHFRINEQISLEKIILFTSFTLNAYSTMRSQFFNTRTDSLSGDVLDSYVVIDPENRTINILDNPPPFINVNNILARELNKYLGFVLPDIMALSSIIAIEPEHIDKVLDTMRVQKMQSQ